MRILRLATSVALRNQGYARKRPSNLRVILILFLAMERLAAPQSFGFLQSEQ